MSKITYKKYSDQRGSILVFSVLFLLTSLIIILAIVAIVLPKLRSVSDVAHSANAIFAADSAMEWCLYGQRGKLPAASPLVLNNGATYQISFNNGPVASCDTTQTPLNHRTIGTYGGTSRAFELSQ